MSRQMKHTRGEGWEGPSTGASVSVELGSPPSWYVGAFASPEAPPAPSCQELWRLSSAATIHEKLPALLPSPKGQGWGD